jgi:hypothetical protein
VAAKVPQHVTTPKPTPIPVPKPVAVVANVPKHITVPKQATPIAVPVATVHHNNPLYLPTRDQAANTQQVASATKSLSVDRLLQIDTRRFDGRIPGIQADVGQAAGGTNSGTMTAIEQAIPGFATRGGQAGSVMAGLRGTPGSHSKNPLDNLGHPLVGGPSNLNAKEGGIDWADWDNGVQWLRQTAGLTDASDDGNVSRYEYHRADGTTIDYEDKKKGFEFHKSGEIRYAVVQGESWVRKGNGSWERTKGTPLPDDGTSSSPRFVTQAGVEAIRARHGSHSQPNPESDTSSGGSVNQFQTAQGHRSTQSMPVDGFSLTRSAAFSANEAEQLAARFQRLINPVSK